MLLDKNSKLSIIGGIGGMVLALGLFFYTSQTLSERVEQAGKNVPEAIDELDSMVNSEIMFCKGRSDPECKEIMVKWYNFCKDEDMQMVPSCTDGRIENYLTSNDLFDQLGN